MRVTLVLADREYPLLEWNSGVVPANENRIGPTVNFILPDADTDRMTLRLEAGEASSVYALCYRRSASRAASRQMNV